MQIKARNDTGDKARVFIESFNTIQHLNMKKETQFVIKEDNRT